MVRLYLDQCHWSDIARGWVSPADEKKLRALAASGQVQLVLSIAHVIETLQCKPRTNPVARGDPKELRARLVRGKQQPVKRLLVDCFNSAPNPIWIKCKDLIIREEVVNYFRDFLGRGKDIHIDPFTSDVFSSIGARVPGALARRRKHPSFRQVVRFIEAASPAQKRRFLTICETERTPVRILYHARSGPACMETLRIFLDPYIPKTLPGGAPVGARLKRAFLVQFDLARCPALMNLVWIVHQMSRAGLRPESGDILDLYHAIPAYSYCDVMVTDKRIADFIRRLRNPEGRFAATFRSLPMALRYIEGVV